MGNNGRYILRGHEPIPCDDLLEWAEWFEDANRRVAENFVGPYRISTVFLGLDHSWGDSPPLLFETMVFPEAEEMDRYSTWAEAEAGHAKIVEQVKAKLTATAEDPGSASSSPPPKPESSSR